MEADDEASWARGRPMPNDVAGSGALGRAGASMPATAPPRLARPTALPARDGVAEPGDNNAGQNTTSPFQTGRCAMRPPWQQVASRSAASTFAPFMELLLMYALPAVTTEHSEANQASDYLGLSGIACIAKTPTVISHDLGHTTRSTDTCTER